MRSLPARLGLLLFPVILVGSGHAADPTIRRLDGKQIHISEADSLACSLLAKEHVTGAQIAVINDGHLVWSAAYGLRDREHSLTMQTTTTTWAASITKSVFATYVMQLAERGQFQIDEPIVRLLPHPLETYPEYRETAAELVRDPRYATITPRILLSHSSGLANFASLEPDKKMHLHFTPGSRFAYSGEGLNLLQFVLEQRLQKPLDEQMQDAIFAPLNMTQTSLVWQERFSGNVADRYDADEKFISHTRRDHARAAGSMTTSVEDLARFTTRLLNDEDSSSRILKPVTLKAMLTPVVTIDATHQFPTFDETKSAEGPAVGLSYGVGWGLLTKTKYGPAFFKEGHGEGAQNYMICFTRHRDCMIILTNSDNGELAFRQLLEGILGDTVTPWVWENYTREGILASRQRP